MFKLTQSEWEIFKRRYNPEVFTKAMMDGWIEDVKEELIKAESGEVLDEPTTRLVNSFRAELSSFQKVTVISNPDESDLKKGLKYDEYFIRPQQVEWLEEEIKKGEENEIEKARYGKYTNTELNRKLGRVGVEFGKKKQEEVKTTREESASKINADFDALIKRFPEKKERFEEKRKEALETSKRAYDNEEGESKDDIKVGDTYHAPATDGGEAIDFTITSIEEGKYMIETTNAEGRKGEHTFDEKNLKELISESKKKGSGKSEPEKFQHNEKRAYGEVRSHAEYNNPKDGRRSDYLLVRKDTGKIIAGYASMNVPNYNKYTGPDNKTPFKLISGFNSMNPAPYLDQKPVDPKNPEDWEK